LEFEAHQFQQIFNKISPFFPAKNPFANYFVLNTIKEFIFVDCGYSSEIMGLLNMNK
jgi:hypothetical protein